MRIRCRCSTFTVRNKVLALHKTQLIGFKDGTDLCTVKKKVSSTLSFYSSPPSSPPPFTVSSPSYHSHFPTDFLIDWLPSPTKQSSPPTRLPPPPRTQPRPRTTLSSSNVKVNGSIGSFCSFAFFSFPSLCQYRAVLTWV